MKPCGWRMVKGTFPPFFTKTRTDNEMIEWVWYDDIAALPNTTASVS
jgi:hypothetical protein